MEDERRREIGLFRYVLIRPVLELGLSRAQRGRLVRAIAEAEHLGPDGRLVRVGRSTLDDWIRRTARAGLRRWCRSLGSWCHARRSGCWGSLLR